MPLKEEFRTQGDFLFKNRGYLPIIIVVAGFLVYYLKELAGTDLSFINRNIYELICIFISLLGFFIRFLSVGFSGDRTSGRNTSEGQIADSVNIYGLYSTCRHPLYVGNFLIWLGVAAFTQDLWFVVAFIFMYWVYYERIMYAEEEFLREKFGDAYTTWASKTPAFIPNFRKYKKPITKFNFKKVIRQEKSGLLNLFFTIFLFDVISQFARTSIFSLKNDYFFIAFVAMLSIYIVIKLIQKTTSWLEDK
ncbi:MAG: isoprenylcysteine carboxylmethyltransferase family protein [Bacteroidota bacterium]|nr:isoprenylcysteine carboxylmethyltransferase family protein [Bacteroidota bacterium]